MRRWTVLICALIACGEGGGANGGASDSGTMSSTDPATGTGGDAGDGGGTSSGGSGTGESGTSDSGPGPACGDGIVTPSEFCPGPWTRYDLGYSSFGLAFADFVEDGALDVVVGVRDDGTDLLLLEGLGDGTLASPTGFAVGGVPWFPQPIDIDGDEHADWVATFGAREAVYYGLGDGAGGFDVREKTAQVAEMFALGDLDSVNGDDIVAIWNDVVRVFANDGAGGWADPVSYDVTDAGDVDIADFDDDGNLDVVVALDSNSGAEDDEIGIMYGNGDGTLGTPELVITDVRLPRQVETADLDGQGGPDLVVRGATRTTIHVADGAGTFAPTELLDTASRVEHFVLADVDVDQVVDIVALGTEYLDAEGRYQDQLDIYVGHGDGTFAPAVTLEFAFEAYARDVAVADINGDGAPDLAVSMASALSLEVALSEP